MQRDFELPGGLQDADLEMAALTRAANREARLRKQGKCAHSWLQGPPGPASEPRTDVLCLHCGKTFPTFEDAYAERRAVLNGD